MSRIHILLRIVLVLVVLAAPSCSGPTAEEQTTASVPGGASDQSTTVKTTEGAASTLPPVTVSSTTTTLPTLEETILQRMTLRQKAAQVLLLAFEGTGLIPATEQLIAEGPPGGLLLLGRNVAGAKQLTTLTAALQTAALAAGNSIELFIAVDQEGGTVQRIREGVPRVPAARTLAEESSLVEVGHMAGETAEGLLAQGVNMNLAPVADVVSDSESFLYSRSYSGDPTVVADYVAIVTRTYAEAGLIPVVKHFPGHGSARGDTHGEAVVSEATQTEFATTHLPPFKTALASGVEGVMMAHVFAIAYDPDLPSSLSPAVVDGLLREGLGFSGLVICDDLEMAGAVLTGSVEPAETAEDAGSAADLGDFAVLALKAGCDLLISTGTMERQLVIMDAIEEAVLGGRLSENRLDQAVLRILEVKSKHGLILPEADSTPEADAGAAKIAKTGGAEWGEAIGDTLADLR
ncbi:MAG: glycoside hydrolase family 3 protein [Thermoleophilia bacterium]|nr:glycoside hydrolase family 3 protein [Thermoleophilia bacterium]